MMKKIKEFRNENYFLSNMYIAPVVFEGQTFSCVESAFQAAKCIQPEDREPFTTLDGYKAKKAGRRVNLRPDWKAVKLDIMYQCVTDKFTRNADLKEKLLATGDAELIEGNTWNDTFWGVCNGKGENHLGKILMHVRSKLR